MTSRDHALVLLRKATDDATAARKFANDAEIADAVVGFHAQQAVEKALKAVLSADERAYPWTHDLRFLVELLDEAGHSLPADFSAIDRLSPWATEFRYGDSIDEELNREAAVQLSDAVVKWAQAYVERTGDG
jgi:HEPN domain-containing protein